MRAERGVGALSAGQDLQQVAVVGAQEDHRVVLGRPGRRVHGNLGQLEPAERETTAVVNDTKKAPLLPVKPSLPLPLLVNHPPSFQHLQGGRCFLMGAAA